MQDPLREQAVSIENRPGDESERATPMVEQSIKIPALGLAMRRSSLRERYDDGGFKVPHSFKAPSSGSDTILSLGGPTTCKISHVPSRTASGNSTPVRMHSNAIKESEGTVA
jgi:hypothetical protein